jgi:hypothetical protein
MASDDDLDPFAERDFLRAPPSISVSLCSWNLVPWSTWPEEPLYY